MSLEIAATIGYDNIVDFLVSELPVITEQQSIGEAYIAACKSGNVDIVETLWQKFSCVTATQTLQRALLEALITGWHLLVVEHVLENFATEITASQWNLEQSAMTVAVQNCWMLDQTAL